jgi:hypothetical protein
MDRAGHPISGGIRESRPGTRHRYSLDDFESRLAVTDVTPRSKLAGVNIVFSVALDAHTGSSVYEEFRDMTFDAFQRAVLFDKRVTGFLFVVKVIPCPGFRGMTCITLSPEMTFVIIVLFVTVVAEHRCVPEERRFMAIAAANRCVPIEKGKSGHLMIEFLHILPAFFRMAFFARLSQPVLMFVVLAVAIDASARNLERFRTMAFGTADPDVFAGKWIGGGRVVERDPHPAYDGVALIAPGPQFALVWIVLLVALVAGLRGLPETRRRMTFLAIDLLMAVNQSEPGFVVIKQDLPPISCGVALLAPGSQYPLVIVVLLVAFHARLRRIPQLPGCVTLEAIDSAVPAFQFKAGFIMIKQVQLPIFGCMTAFAFLSQCAFMLVLFSMTGDACRRRGLELIRDMAFLTGDTRMFAFQGEVGSGVVKTNSVPCLRIMASLAGFSERSFVFVFLEMA